MTPLFARDETAARMPASVKRAIDDWLARGYAVEIGSDGTLRVTPQKPQDDLDLVQWGRK